MKTLLFKRPINNQKPIGNSLLEASLKLMLALLIVFALLPASVVSAAGMEGRKTPSLLPAPSEGRRTPVLALLSLVLQADSCQQIYTMGDINIAWKECQYTNATSGILYRSNSDGFGGWQFWGVYSYAEDGTWKYLLHRSNVYYAVNIYTAHYYVWNGRQWIDVEYSQIPW